MATEFERVKCDLCGRSIMVTSWYDDARQGWRASAPAYSHIRAVSDSMLETACETRDSAIDRLVQVLEAYLSSAPPIADGPEVRQPQA